MNQRQYHGQKLSAEEVLRLYAEGNRDFRGIILRGGNFCEADLSGADFAGADIRGAKFGDANLKTANLNHIQAGCDRWRVRVRLLCVGMIAGLAGLLQGFAAISLASLFASDNLNVFEEIFTLLFMMGLGLFAIYLQGKLNLNQQLSVRFFGPLFITLNLLFFLFFSVLFLEDGGELIVAGPLFTFIVVFTVASVISIIASKYNFVAMDEHGCLVLMVLINAVVWVAMLTFTVPITATILWSVLLSGVFVVAVSRFIGVALAIASVTAIAVVFASDLATSLSTDTALSEIYQLSLIAAVKVAAPIVLPTSLLAGFIYYQSWHSEAR